MSVDKNWIDVKIPFDEHGQLAMAYNRALSEGTSEWVLFLDHDIFLCNPLWYKMSLAATKHLSENDPKAACVGCVTMAKVPARDIKRGVTINDSIGFHIGKAKQAYTKYGTTLIRRKQYVTGFFLLVNRKIASEIGFIQPVPGNINKIDVDFGTRVINAGYHNYQMPGLYVYHRRGMRYLEKDFVYND